MSDGRPIPGAPSEQERQKFWERNERIRAAELRAATKRPMGELLEEGVALSRFATELAAAPRTEP